MKIILVIILLLFMFSSSIFGQTVASTPSPQQNTQQILQERQRQQAEIDRRSKEFERLRSGDRQNDEAAFARRESFPFKSPINKEQRRQLEPDAQLISTYSEFLKQPRTGLIKLFPNTGCEDNSLILRADVDCLGWIPNSAFYSFREKEHTTDFLADIAYQNNAFVSNGVLSQGILTALGDVSLETVTLSTRGMKYLVEYKAALQSREALKQFREISRGVKSDGYIYAKALPVLDGVTYAARIIAYKGRFLTTYRGRLFNVLDGDKRLDFIVAFRVVGKNEDGSISVLWKELFRKNAPTVIYPKKSKKQMK